jgi:cytochrome c oxidase subunit 2
MIAASSSIAAFAQSALDPAGPQAAHIDHLWWLLFWVSTAVFVLVLAVLFAALAVRRPPEATVTLNPGPEGERRRFRAVAAATGVTVAVLFGLLVASVATGREIASLEAPRALTVEVVGHQWWWEVHYLDPDSSGSFVTANEIHIPVGKPVLVRAIGRDVIHSLWIPNLHGKRDLIPGRTSVIWLQADRPGLYRGQCAEFCGYQHAHMALDVFADPPARFAAWVAAQRQSPPPPAATLEQRGEQVFLGAACALCHTIQGTGANGQNAPDLTHLASRRTLAAGALPNTRVALSSWILDPGSAKPGSHMPPTNLHPDDLQALVAYLETLK